MSMSLSAARGHRLTLRPFFAGPTASVQLVQVIPHAPHAREHVGLQPVPRHCRTTRLFLDLPRLLDVQRTLRVRRYAAC